MPIEKNHLDFSIIVFTSGEVEDLKKCLLSIVNQTFWPKEVLLFDSSKEDVCGKTAWDIFAGIGIPFFHFKTVLGPVSQKNLAVRKALGEVIQFVEDDLVLESNYLEEIWKVYQKYPQVKGVQGKLIEPDNEKFVGNSIRRVFHYEFFQGGGNRVFSSFYPSWNLKPDKELKSLVLNSNASYKKEVFEKFRFDEDIEKISSLVLYDDVDFSFNLSKKGQYVLSQTPNAILRREKNHIALNQMEKSRMSCHYFFWQKNILSKERFITKVIYLWLEFVFSEIGRLLVNIMISVRKLNFDILLSTFQSYLGNSKSK